MKQKILTWVIHNDKISIVLVLVIVLLGLLFAGIPKIDGSLDGLKDESNKYLINKRSIDSTFELDQLILVEIIPENVSHNEVIESCNQIAKSIKAELPKAEIISLHDFESFIKSDKIAFQSIKKSLKNAQALSMTKSLIAKDLSSFLMIIEPNGKKTKEIPDILDNVFESQKKGISEFRFSSIYHIEKEISSSLKKDMKLIPFWILLAFTGIILLAFRSTKAMIYIIWIVTCSLLPCFTLFNLISLKLNIVLVLVMPIVAILVLADCVHILSAYFSYKEKDIKKRLLKIYENYAIPSFLTSITTAIAFYSLSFSSISSISNLGIISGSSILIAFIITYLSTPFVLLHLKPKGKLLISPVIIGLKGKMIKKISSWTLIIIFLISLFKIPGISFKNNPEVFYPENSQLGINQKSLSKNYYSLSTVDLMLIFNDNAPNPKKIVRELSSKLSQLESVHSISHSQLFSNFLLPPSLRKQKDKFQKNGGNQQRLNIKMDQGKSVHELEKEMHQILKNYDDFNYIISSPILVFKTVNDQVATSMLRSLVFSLIILLFIFLILTKSFAKSLTGMLVNIVPLSFIVLFFTLFDLHLNMLTSLTVVVCLGLIVDDTIHAFYRKVVLKKKHLSELAYGMVVTTVVLCLCFISLTTTLFKPNATFGIISAITFAVALFSDLTLLPYLIEKWEQKFEKHG